MECNKEEAIRAKEIAEKKMQNKDFVGARRIALKAQQLYPDIENLFQMLTVCDVHCSAENKILGSEMDWYGILQITQTADESSIKKQYRKLALLLHPDKNKFAGAEAAFKLIGEAQRVLTDQQKRSLYDMKCKDLVRSAAPKPPRQPVKRNTSARKPCGPQNNFMNTTSQQFTGLNMRQQQQKQNPPEFPNDQQTFWTICTFCGIRYQYYRNILNKSLRCQSCSKPFIAYDLGAQGPPAGVNGNKSAFAQQKGVPGQGAKVGSQSTPGNLPAGLGSKGTFGTGTAEPQTFPKMGSTSDVGRDSKSTGKEDGNVDMGVGEEGKRRPKNQAKPEESEPSGNKRQRKLDKESSGSCDTRSSGDPEEDAVFKEDGAHPSGRNRGAHYPRRSIRQKINVIYKENLSDDNDLEMETPLEENLPNRKNETETCKENGKEADVVDGSKLIESPKTMPDPEYYDYPDPDFSNFDQLRELNKFAVDQIWALYDTIDAMPRFYARVRKVYSPEFKVRITWLEPIPDDKDEIDWVEEDLPVACGRFKHGKTEDTQDQLMFSHVTTWERSSRGSYKIYPRKGETWALFKDWDIKWNSDPENHRTYKYEFVEVLSEYSEDTGVTVVYLGKMKGFVSLFSQIKKEGIHSFKIPPNELLKFSHRIPSFRLTGMEREDVTEGSYEFDPASLPTDVEVFNRTEDVKLDNGSEGSCPKFSKENAKPMAEPIFPDTKQNGSDLDEENALETRNSENSNQKKPIELNGTLNKPSQANVSQCAGKEKTQNHLSNVKNVSCDGFTEAGVSTCQNDEKRHKVVEDTISGGITEDPGTAPASSSSSEPNEIPGTEFYEFDNDKSFDKFKTGQIWALYSDHDGMPKFYGKIKKIKPPPDLTLCVTWIEACPLREGIIDWTHEDMPVCCGEFKLGNDTDEYNSTSSFSHQLKAVAKGKKYVIHPRQGEVWALYRNWDAKWTVSNLSDCKYDVVEILECNTFGTKVQSLVLVDGYKTIYKATKKRGSTVTMEIPQRDLLRFSHQVPGIRLTEEKNGSLRGCWELDPGSCPKFSKKNAKPMMEPIFPNTKQNGSDLDEENALETRNSENSNQKEPIELNGTLNKPSQANVSQCAGKEKTQNHLSNVKNVSCDGFTEAGVSKCQNDEKRHKVVEDTISGGITEDPGTAPPSSSSSEPDEIPGTEFYEFDTDKSFEKFKTGQIWALYSDHDGMPKFYGKIKKIKPPPDGPDFTLCVTWLEACPLREGIIDWIHEDMPVCCGEFKLGNDTDEYNSTSSFSHQLKAVARGKKYVIHPRQGEVWALYRNWDAKWTVSNLSDCKYDVVEILECNTLGTKVQSLVLVDGYKTVYKATKKRGSTVTMEIPQRELLRFSHQVPGIRLTEEKNGSLRGCWELDPASLPCP
ncbi:uncharacterized protein LOC122658637 [Telopea speciosissima]|uniref:uncharacterized protein LOC122658637 n=1 Tax=Telopea speciosissima TaxID=54955 RepID=UPI001CC82409|nr:uncharacterized protein LOC122658637 [Telopea speciosissima]